MKIFLKFSQKGIGRHVKGNKQKEKFLKKTNRNKLTGDLLVKNSIVILD